jgi:hypothetical protein
MGVAAIFLDAGYLSKVLWHDHANARIDFSKLALEMAEPDQLLRAYYYNCLPYQGNRLPRTRDPLFVHAPVYHGIAVSSPL